MNKYTCILLFFQKNQRMGGLFVYTRFVGPFIEQLCLFVFSDRKMKAINFSANQFLFFYYHFKDFYVRNEIWSRKTYVDGLL